MSLAAIFGLSAVTPGRRSDRNLTSAESGRRGSPGARGFLAGRPRPRFLGASPWPGASLLDPAAIPAADPEAVRLLRGMAEAVVRSNLTEKRWLRSGKETSVERSDFFAFFSLTAFGFLCGFPFFLFRETRAGERGI